MEKCGLLTRPVGTVYEGEEKQGKETSNADKQKCQNLIGFK